ncbi:OsmC family protein [Rhodococcus opacus]|uniref:OsmC family protein n=1 Tax=Rhodococcus opacus TaxID=37919 RepID=UPI0022359536|nr:OsmC family protein [Rhodococcus opacus]UZG60278.1 OsmC family protein [Rhodococcus opacus]
MTANALAMTIQGAVDHVKQNPSAAQATYKAKVLLDKGVQCSAFVRKFPAIILDEPPNLGGNDAGPNPVEVLLVSLGACQEMVYAIYASMMGIELDSVTVYLKGHLDVRGFMGEEGVPPGYQEITFETRIESQADAKSIEALIRTVEACCPTMDTIRRPVEVRGKAFLNGEPVVAV